LLDDDDLDSLAYIGFIVKKSFASQESVDIIKNDAVQMLAKTPDAVEYFDYVVKRSYYRFELPSLLAVSVEAANVLLRNELLDFASKYFGGVAYVAECELRGSLRVATDAESYLDGNILYTHSDLPLRSEKRSRNGIYAFLMLTDVDCMQGPTFLFEKSHLINPVNNSNLTSDFVSKATYLANQSKIKLKIFDSLGAGDLLIFDMDVWHGRLPAKLPGRFIALIKFFPELNTHRLENLLVSTEVLSRLNGRQLTSLIGPDRQFARPTRAPMRLEGRKSYVKIFDRSVVFIDKFFVRILSLKTIFFKLRPRVRELIFFTGKRQKYDPNLLFPDDLFKD